MALQTKDVCRTVFGSASVFKMARIGDGIVELRLTEWRLANGEHPRLFAPEGKLTRIDATAGTKTWHANTSVGAIKSNSTWCTPASGRTTLGGDTVELLNDHHFAKIRAAMGVPTDILATRGQWKFEDLKMSGGKGGDMMGRSCGSTFGKFFVKEVSGSDHETLLKIAGEYAEHIVSPGGSFICRFYMHVRHIKTGKFYVVMNNWIPSIKAVSQGQQTKLERPHDEYQFLYDLKGAADDKTQRRDSVTVKEVHMRCWHCRDICREYVCGPSLCGAATPARQAYRDGKTHAITCTFEVAAGQRKIILARIEKDVSFLARLGLMDYSLIVGVKKAKVGRDADELRTQGGFLPGDSPDQPFQVLSEGGNAFGFYIGIIDFLQEWTLKKTVAHCIKTIACAPKPLATVPPKEYGERFVAYFKNKFVASGVVLDEYIAADSTSTVLGETIVTAMANEAAVLGASKGQDDDGDVAQPDFVEISLR